MKKMLLLYANPEFDIRIGCGISRLYQIFTKEHGYNIEIINDEILKSHIPDQNDIIVIAGGDGTIHRVINLIPEKYFGKYIFGIMPCGTANEFAKSIGLSLFFEEAAEVIAHCNNTISIKIGLLNKIQRFTTGFLYGIACNVLQQTTEFSKHHLGEYAYQLPGLFAVADYYNFLKTFKIGSLKFDTGYLLINTASLISKNITIEKEDKDAFSIIYLASDLRTNDFIRLMLKNQVGGNILEDPALLYFREKELILEFDGNIEFMLDGEIYIIASPISFEHFMQEMKVIV